MNKFGASLSGVCALVGGLALGSIVTGCAGGAVIVDDATVDHSSPADISHDILQCAGTPCDDRLDCTKDSCIDGECTHELQANNCLIDGKCWSAGSSDPGSCLRCDPTISPTSWQQVPSLCTDDNLSCTTTACVAGDCEVTLLPGYCLVDNTCVADGQTNPNDNCQVCQTSVATDRLQPKANGIACNDDKLPCTSDTCQQGHCTHNVQANQCLINGVCYLAGETNPASDCQSCTPTISQTFWDVSADGVPCRDDNIQCTTDACFAGSCGHEVKSGFCLIAGNCYKAADTNPVQECEHCDPIANVEKWSNKATGQACNADAFDCTDDVCNGGKCTHAIKPTSCLITGSCYNVDAPHPTLACRSCRPDQLRTGWSIAADTQPCSADQLSCTNDVCQNGVCGHPLRADACLINGTCYTKDSAVASNTCTICAPSQSQSATTAADGQICTDNNSTTPLDVCVQGSCRGLSSRQWEWLESDQATNFSSVGVVPGQTASALGIWATGRFTDAAGSSDGFIIKLNAAAAPGPTHYVTEPMLSVHDRLASGEKGQIRYYTGSNWVTPSTVASQLGTLTVNSVWGTTLGSVQEFFIGASGTRILRCTTTDSGVSFSCSDGTGLPSGANIIRVFGTTTTGALGAAWALRGNSWEDIYYNPGNNNWTGSPPGGCLDPSQPACAGTSGRFIDLWANGDRDVWAVGEQGLVMRYDGSSWTKIIIPSLTSPLQSAYTFRGVYGQGDVITLVGERNVNNQFHDMIVLTYNQKLNRWFSPKMIYYTSYANTQKAAFRFYDVGGIGFSQLQIVGSIYNDSAQEQRALHLYLP